MSSQLFFLFFFAFAFALTELNAALCWTKKKLCALIYRMIVGMLAAGFFSFIHFLKIMTSRMAIIAIDNDVGQLGKATIENYRAIFTKSVIDYSSLLVVLASIFEITND